ncbi:hypothetical protein D3C87_1804780 [compost metagenome]
MDARFEKDLGRGEMQVIGSDDGDRLDPVFTTGLGRRHLLKRSVGPLGRNAEQGCRNAGACRVGGKRTGDQFVTVVEPRGDTMHRADKGTLTATHHAETNAAAIKSCCCGGHVYPFQSPRRRRLAASSVPLLAKSSKARSVTRMM